MNPVGFDLFPVLPETPEGATRSVERQSPDQGDFLSEFLEMIFADSQPNTKLSEQAQESVGTNEETDPSCGKCEEGFLSEFKGDEWGSVLSPGSASELLADELVSTDESGASPPLKLQGLETGEKEDPLSGKERVVESKEEIPPLPGSTGGGAKLPGNLTEDVTLQASLQQVPSATGQAGVATSSESESSLIPKTSESVLSKWAVAEEGGIKADPRAARPIQGSGSFGQMVPVSAGESSMPDSAQNEVDHLIRPASRERTPDVPLNPVPERDPQFQRSPSVHVEISKAGANVARTIPEVAGESSSNKQQSGTGSEGGFTNGKDTEVGFRAVSVSTEPARLETAKRVETDRWVEPDQNATNRIDHEKRDRVVFAPSSAETEKHAETNLMPKAGTNLVGGGERLSLHEPVAARALVQAQSPQEFDRMLDQIVKQISLRREGETFQLGVRLKPEFLGELRIETIMDADKTMRAVILAEDPSVKALLEGKVASLVQRFEEIGIHVDKVEIQTLLTDVGSGHDSSKDRPGSGQPANAKAAQPELSEEVEGETESEIDDGHLHLYI